MRWLALAVLLLAGCARRYMLITAGPMLDCDQELKTRQMDDPIWYRVSGCGRTVYCQQLIWAGADEWSCQTKAP